MNGVPVRIKARPAGASLADVSADGRQFLLFKTAGETAAAPKEFRVILNFVEEMKRKVAAGQ